MIKTLSRLADVVARAQVGRQPRELVDYCSELYFRPYYELLRLLAMYQTHGICVELGVERGRGSFAMCLGGGTVYGMDHTRRGEMAVLEARFPGHFHYVEQSSLPIPRAILDQDQPIAVLHVDTEHSYAQAREEFYAYQPLLATPAVVCFDDTHAQESAVGHFVTTLRWPTIFDDRLHECGYAVMLYTGDR
jgi:hypothetical protein